MTNARVQNGTLGASDPLFYVTLVRDDSPEGDVFRDTHWLTIFVDGLPQYDAA